jgi:hypothetical protein
MANYAFKAPSSTLRPLLLGTAIHTAVITAIAGASKEWVIIQGTILQLPPPLSSRTVICAAYVVAIMKQGKERVTCQGTIVHTVAAFHHCALLNTPLQSLRLRMTARNAQ